MGRFSRLETDHGDKNRRQYPASDALHDALDKYPEPTPSDDTIDIGPAEIMERGDQAFYNRNFKVAMRWYSRAIDRDSTAIDCWVALIRALLFKGDLREAGTWINRGLTLTPSSPPLLAMRAVLYAQKGMLRQALNNSDRVLEDAGQEPIAHMARGEVLLLADNKNADFCFEQCLKLVPSTDWRTPLVIGMIHQNRRLWAKAIQYYAKAAEINERLAVLWYHVGACRAELGHALPAEKAFNRARELCAPDDPLLVKIFHAKPGSVWRRIVRLFRRK